MKFTKSGLLFFTTKRVINICNKIQSIGDATLQSSYVRLNEVIFFPSFKSVLAGTDWIPSKIYQQCSSVADSVLSFSPQVLSTYQFLTFDLFTHPVYNKIHHEDRREQP